MGEGGKRGAINTSGECGRDRGGGRGIGAGGADLSGVWVMKTSGRYWYEVARW